MKRKQKELKAKIKPVDPESLDPDILGLVVRMIGLGILPASVLKPKRKKRVTLPKVTTNNPAVKTAVNCR